MSGSTPTGATALLIVLPFVIIILVLVAAIQCASKGSYDWRSLGHWTKEKLRRHKARSSSDESNVNDAIP